MPSSLPESRGREEGSAGEGQHSVPALCAAAGLSCSPSGIAGALRALYKEEEGSFLSYPAPWERAARGAWQYLAARRQAACGQGPGGRQPWILLPPALPNEGQGPGASE